LRERRSSFYTVFKSKGGVKTVTCKEITKRRKKIESNQCNYIVLSFSNPSQLKKEKKERNENSKEKYKVINDLV